MLVTLLSALLVVWGSRGTESAALGHTELRMSVNSDPEVEGRILSLPWRARYRYTVTSLVTITVPVYCDATASRCSRRRADPVLKQRKSSSIISRRKNKPEGKTAPQAVSDEDQEDAGTDLKDYVYDSSVEAGDLDNSAEIDIFGGSVNTAVYGSMESDYATDTELPDKSMVQSDTKEETEGSQPISNHDGLEASLDKTAVSVAEQAVHHNTQEAEGQDDAPMSENVNLSDVNNSTDKTQNGNIAFSPEGEDALLVGVITVTPAHSEPEIDSEQAQTTEEKNDEKAQAEHTNSLETVQTEINDLKTDQTEAAHHLEIAQMKKTKDYENAKTEAMKDLETSEQPVATEKTNNLVAGQTEKSGDRGEIESKNTDELATLLQSTIELQSSQQQLGLLGSTATIPTGILEKARYLYRGAVIVTSTVTQTDVDVTIVQFRADCSSQLVTLPACDPDVFSLAQAKEK